MLIRQTVLVVLMILLTTKVVAAEVDAIAGRVFVLGDSYSDIGNWQRLPTVSEQEKARVNAIKHAGRASNGLIWIDYLFPERAAVDAFGRSNQDLKDPTLSVFNYAVSSAMSNGYAAIHEPNWLLPVKFKEYGVLKQIEQIDAHWQQIGPKDAIFVWIGFNDAAAAIRSQKLGKVRRLLASVMTPMELNSVEESIHKTINNITKTVNWAMRKGFGRVYVLSLGAGGIAPMMQGEPQAYMDAFEKHNQLLYQALKVLPDQSSAHIQLIDMYKPFQVFVNESTGSTGIDFTGACVDVVNRSICDSPDEFFFWDLAHPTTRGHQLIADYIASQLP